MTNIKENLERTQKRIHDACIAARRPIEEVELLAVSKKHSVQSIREVMGLGLSRFGENYAQEMLQKQEELSGTQSEFVFIGQLQSNKIQRIVRAAAEIQTVSSIKHVRLIAKYAKATGKAPYPIYLILNAGDEPQKAGLNFKDLEALSLEVTENYPELTLKGVMCIPPASIATSASIDNIPELYKKIKDLSLKVGQGKLSLGMSHDLETAIKTGSTCVRIGTDIFGSRD